MLGFAFAALAMLEQASAIIWKNDGTVEITTTFVATEPRNPFPQGTALLLTMAKEACGEKGAPVPVSEPVVVGLTIAEGKPKVAMSGTYACRQG